MTGSRAFTLVELLVYTVLFSLLMVWIIGFFQTIYGGLQGKNTVVIEQLNNALVLDLIKRDCMSASGQPGDWDAEQGVFKKYTLTAGGKPVCSTVGWQMRKNKLCRIEGSYDFIKHCWGKRSISYVKCSIQSLNLQPVRMPDERYSTHVRVRFSNGGKQHEVYCMLRNRIVL